MRLGSWNNESGVVYSILCEDCDVEYIGETGRAFGTRQDEHERAVRLKEWELRVGKACSWWGSLGSMEEIKDFM